MEDKIQEIEKDQELENVDVQTDSNEPSTDSTDKPTRKSSKKKISTPREELLKQRIADIYARNYPKVKTWYVTSDDAVFVGSAHSDALYHQRKINESNDSQEEILTIKFQ